MSYYLRSSALSGEPGPQIIAFSTTPREERARESKYNKPQWPTELRGVITEYDDSKNSGPLNFTLHSVHSEMQIMLKGHGNETDF